jgi:hypothetical protein
MKLLPCLLALAIIPAVSAGTLNVGISPTSILEDRLLPGSQVERTIQLSQSGETQDLMVTIEIPPALAVWLTIVNDTFMLPSDRSITLLAFHIDIPSDSQGTRNGTIAIKVRPRQASDIGTELVFPVHVNMTVVGEEISDYQIKHISIPETRQGTPLLVNLDIDNKGNIPARPDSIILHIADNHNKSTLMTLESTTIRPVPPLTKTTTTVAFTTNLAPGQYLATVRPFSNGSALGDENILFDITENTAKHGSYTMPVIATTLLMALVTGIMRKRR